MRNEPKKHKSLKRVTLGAGFTTGAPNPYMPNIPGIPMELYTLSATISTNDYNSKYEELCSTPAPAGTDHVGMYLAPQESTLFVFFDFKNNPLDGFIKS